MTVPTVPFEKAARDVTGGNPKVQRGHYLSAGVLPVIDQGQTDIAGYSDDADASYRGALPVVLFGDHTRALKYVDRPFALGADGVKALLPREGFDAKFLYYYWSSCDIPSHGYSRHFRFLKDLPVSVFAPSEQRRIVEILDQADALRKLRREADAKVARILPALFLKMFGDPATNPMGWPTGALGNFGVKARYGLGQPPKAAADGLPLIRATNIHAGRISTVNMIYVDPAAVPQSRNAILDANEVVVVRSGAYTGDAAQVTDDWKGSVVGYDLVATPPEEWTGEFLEQFLLTPFVQRGYFAAQRTRAGQPHLNSSQLEATPIFAPDSATQLTFAKAVRETRSIRNALSDAADSLDKLFNSMLQRAFSGELTAKWRQAHMQKLLVEMREQARLLDLPVPKELETAL